MTVVLVLQLFAFQSTGYCISKATVDQETHFIFDVQSSLSEFKFSCIDEYDNVSLKGGVFMRKPGHPQLPYKVVHVIIPRDAEAIDIEIMNTTMDQISGKYNLYPGQETIPFGDEDFFTPPDNTIYRSDERYPAEIVNIGAQGFMRGVHIVTLHVYPLQYVPLSGKLYILNTINFKVVLEKVSSARVGVMNVKLGHSADDYLKKIVLNPESLDAYYGSFSHNTTDSSIDYLIITSDSLINSNVFGPFVAGKQSKGLSVVLTSIQWILNNYLGRDSQEKIRSYIVDVYNNSGLVYVLLGGDTNIVPGRKTRAYYEDVICDMYYSDLDGNWDANDNNYFGEFADNVDFYPDVFVGRAPVENETEAQAFINKVSTYETNITGYYNKALFLGCDDFGNTGAITKDLIDDSYFPPSFDPITKYYEDTLGSYSALTIQAMNQGYHLINHIDHAYVNQLSTGSDVIYTYDIDNLHNSFTPSIIWSCGCNPAAIDYDCIAEHWITNPGGGGVAFIGNSRSGLHPESDQMLDPEFYQSLFIEGITEIGMTLADSKIPFIGLANTDPSMRMCMMELNLLGDPAMNIMIQYPVPELNRVGLLVLILCLSFLTRFHFSKSRLLRKKCDDFS